MPTFRANIWSFGQFAILIFLEHFSVSSSESPLPCAILFSERNFEGIPILVNHQGQVSDLQEDSRISGLTANKWETKSVQVFSGCNLRACNDSYFDGACDTFKEGSYPGLSEQNISDTRLISDILSIQCTCKQECDCMDAPIKTRSCGRAYFQGGCKTCDTLYMDLKPNQKQVFPKQYMDKVEAVRVRDGCKLSIFSNSDLTSNVINITEPIVENFGQNISSYQCECNNDAVYVPSSAPARDIAWPKPVDLPESMNDVIKMFANASLKDHPGLTAARDSFRARRSHKNAYILLLGTTGAGKSSAINLLFDNPNITKVGNTVSTTTDIHEFRIPVSVDELGIANSELRVIDTPGLGDTRNLEYDVRYLATLDDYLSNHQELKERIPNVVLIFHPFTDNRFAGTGSSFVKMIRALELFRTRITDAEYSNVIFVFSHFCHASPQQSRRPSAKLKQFLEVIRDYSLFPKPLHTVVAENRPEDRQLPMLNGYWQLPNLEYYPKNLFLKMDLVTEKAGDPLGMGVFRSAFRDSENFNISSRSHKLAKRDFKNVPKYLSILSRASVGDVNSEVDSILNETWHSQNASIVRSKFPSSLAYLQRSFSLRNINEINKIPKTTAGLIDLLSGLRHDAGVTFLLENGLNISMPVFPRNTVAGYGYNIFNDKPLLVSPFSLGLSEQSDIGFLLPSALTCKIEKSVATHFSIFETKQEYIDQRLHSLGVEGIIPVNMFRDFTLPGYHIRNVSFGNDGFRVSAVKEFRNFEFVLNNRLPLTPQFEADVIALKPFNHSDAENVYQWNYFFDNYGTHVVKSVFGGGRIIVKMASTQKFHVSFIDSFWNMLNFAENLAYDDKLSGDSYNWTYLKNETTLSITFDGGNQNKVVMDLAKVQMADVHRKFSEWRQSLRVNPVVFANEMQLLTVSEIAKKVSVNSSKEIERATHLFYKSKLNIFSSKLSEYGPGYDRKHTPRLTNTASKTTWKKILKHVFTGVAVAASVVGGTVVAAVAIVASGGVATPAVVGGISAAVTGLGTGTAYVLNEV